jgi:cystathionine beta-lyase/cystathionine gamma-synthase
VTVNREHLATKLVRGSGEAAAAAPLTTPIYSTTTFVFESAEDVRQYQEGRSQKYLYSRYENPTVVEVEARIAALDSAELGLLFSSGMAAVATTMMALLKAGDEVVCSAGIYGGTAHFLQDLLSKFSVTTRFVTLEELRDSGRLVGPRTRIVWFESPINPTLRCVDVTSIAQACERANVLSVIDNTFATAVNQQPLARGVTLVMQSATKYLNGHSDVTGGAVTGGRTLVERISKARRLLGTVMDPAAAYNLGRGLKTLLVRMDRHNASALALARALEQDGRIARVCYPGLESHPDHRLAKAQMNGFSGMVAIDLETYEGASRVFDRLRVIRRAASLGGVESLASLPVLTSHWGHSHEQLAAAGISPGLIRISVGLEDVGDLIEDVKQALG